MRSKFLKPFEEDFCTMIKAAKAERLLLLECTDSRTGKKVAAVCTVGGSDNSKDVQLTPFAVMLEGDPFDYLTPPDGVVGADLTQVLRRKAADGKDSFLCALCVEEFNLTEGEKLSPKEAKALGGNYCAVCSSSFIEESDGN